MAGIRRKNTTTASVSSSSGLAREPVECPEDRAGGQNAEDQVRGSAEIEPRQPSSRVTDACVAWLPQGYFVKNFGWLGRYGLIQLLMVGGVLTLFLPSLMLGLIAALLEAVVPPVAAAASLISSLASGMSYVSGGGGDDAELSIFFVLTAGS